jgi:hypothetical protein
MNAIIYSTSPLGAFANTFYTVGGVLAVGVIGLVYAFTRRDQSRQSRLGLVIAGAFLCLVGIVVAFVTLANLATKTQTAVAVLNKKTIALDNCSEGETCSRYLLEMTAGAKSYDFTVVDRAYNAAREGGCYRVTYYPNHGLFAMDYGTDEYVATSYVTRIAQAQPSDCQP